MNPDPPGQIILKEQRIQPDLITPFPYLYILHISSNNLSLSTFVVRYLLLNASREM